MTEMKKTKKHEVKTARGFLGYGNTRNGFEMFRKEYTEPALESREPQEELFNLFLEDDEQNGLMIGEDFLLLQRFHKEGTPESHRPHYVSQCLVFEPQLKEQVFAYYYEDIMKTLKPELNETQIRELKNPGIQRKHFYKSEELELLNRPMGNSERLLLLELALNYTRGQRYHIDFSGVRDTDLLSLIKLLSHAFPRQSLSVNYDRPVTDFYFSESRGAGQAVVMSELSSALLKESKVLSRIFQEPELACAFIRTLSLIQPRKPVELQEKAQSYLQERERKDLGIWRISANEEHTLELAAAQYDVMTQTPEAQAALLKELERALREGDLSWSKYDKPFILGLLSVCFAFNGEALAQQQSRLPAFPMFRCDMKGILDWLNDQIGSGIAGIRQKEARKLLIDFVQLALNRYL